MTSIQETKTDWFRFDPETGWTATPPCEASELCSNQRAPVALGKPDFQDGMAAWAAMEADRKARATRLKGAHDAFRVSRAANRCPTRWTCTDFDCVVAGSVFVDVSEAWPGLIIIGIYLGPKERFSFPAKTVKTIDAEAEAILAAKKLFPGHNVYCDHEKMAAIHGAIYIPRRLNGLAHAVAKHRINLRTNACSIPEPRMYSLRTTPSSYNSLRSWPRQSFRSNPHGRGSTG